MIFQRSICTVIYLWISSSRWSVYLRPATLFHPRCRIPPREILFSVFPLLACHLSGAPTTLASSVATFSAELTAFICSIEFEILSLEWAGNPEFMSIVSDFPYGRAFAHSCGFDMPQGSTGMFSQKSNRLLSDRPNPLSSVFTLSEWTLDRLCSAGSTVSGSLKVGKTSLGSIAVESTSCGADLLTSWGIDTQVSFVGTHRARLFWDWGFWLGSAVQGRAIQRANAWGVTVAQGVRPSKHAVFHLFLGRSRFLSRLVFNLGHRVSRAIRYHHGHRVVCYTGWIHGRLLMFWLDVQLELDLIEFSRSYLASEFQWFALDQLRREYVLHALGSIPRRDCGADNSPGIGNFHSCTRLHSVVVLAGTFTPQSRTNWNSCRGCLTGFQGVAEIRTRLISRVDLLVLSHKHVLLDRLDSLISVVAFVSC